MKVNRDDFIEGLVPLIRQAAGQDLPITHEEMVQLFEGEPTREGETATISVKQNGVEIYSTRCIATKPMWSIELPIDYTPPFQETKKGSRFTMSMWLWITGTLLVLTGAYLYERWAK